jgi:hypothetical protein
MDHLLVILLFLGAVTASPFTHLSPEQVCILRACWAHKLTHRKSSEVHHALETLTATRPEVISVQSEVRAALPPSVFPNAQIGPFYQDDYASLIQDPTPVFTTHSWYSKLPAPLQTAYAGLEEGALAIERSIISDVVYGTSQEKAEVTKTAWEPKSTGFATVVVKVEVEVPI